MKPQRIPAPCLVFAAAACVLPGPAGAHGFVGQRFFPATLATDDPFVADELSFPTLSSVRSNATDDAPGGHQTSAAIDFSKRITTNLGLSVGTAWNRFRFPDQAAVTGHDNVELGLKYQFWRDEAHEALASAGVSWEVGGSGSRSIGADRFNTYTPTVFFGKGFGDLGPGQEMLRPLAVTGTLGIAIPDRSGTTTTGVDPDSGLPVSQTEQHPHVLQVGFALMYSLPYLQSAVKDVGLGAPWNRMIPLVEFQAAKPLDRVDDRRWTGTVNPGVLWAGRYVQLGLEAVVPINHASGRGVGVLAQLHFFLDDLFPTTFGRPLLAEAR
jgi:hypothetical protein